MYTPRLADVSSRPSPNPPYPFPGNGLSRSQLSASKITLRLVILVRFPSFTLWSVRTSSDLLLPLYWRSVDSLAPFPLCPTFSCSEYYEASDARANPRRTARLDILASASHVHSAGLDKGREVAVSTMTSSALGGIPSANRVRQVAG